MMMRILLMILFLPVMLAAQPEPQDSVLFARKVKSMDVRWYEKSARDTFYKYYEYDRDVQRIIAKGEKSFDSEYFGKLTYHSNGHKDSEYYLRAFKTDAGLDSGAFGSSFIYDSLDKTKSTGYINWFLKGSKRRGFDTISTTNYHFTYDKNGWRKDETIRFSGYNESGKYIYTRDSLGREIKREYYYGGKRMSATLSRYDSLGLLIIETTYDQKGALSEETHYIYTNYEIAETPFIPRPDEYRPTKTKSGTLGYHFMSKSGVTIYYEYFSFLPGGIRETDRKGVYSFKGIKNDLFKSCTRKVTDKKGKVTESNFKYTYTFY